MLRTKNLFKTYRLGSYAVEAIRGISFSIHRGEFVAIMGASGSGKSTLMNILGCLDRPSQGRYFLDGQDVSSLSADELAEIRNKKTGFVFQGFNLLPRTSALENVEVPLLYQPKRIGVSEQRRRAIECLEMVGLADRLRHHPNALSGGQQQRVAIARAFVNKPSLVLADEPTGNLDTRSSAEIVQIFQTLNTNGMTIVIVTHEPCIAQACPRRIVMKDGQIVEDCAPVDDKNSAVPASVCQPGDCREFTQDE